MSNVHRMRQGVAVRLRGALRLLGAATLLSLLCLLLAEPRALAALLRGITIHFAGA